MFSTHCLIYTTGATVRAVIIIIELRWYEFNNAPSYKPSYEHTRNPVRQPCRIQTLSSPPIRFTRFTPRTRWSQTNPTTVPAHGTVVDDCQEWRDTRDLRTYLAGRSAVLHLSIKTARQACNVHATTPGQYANIILYCLSSLFVININYVIVSLATISIIE